MAAVSAEMKRPAEGDAPASPRKKARKNPSVSEGEVSDGVDEGEVDSDGDYKAPEEAGPEAVTTWNSGITNKLRTSFGMPSQPAEPPRKPEPGLGMPSGLNTEVRDGLAAAFRADEERMASPVSGEGLSWALPAFKADSVVGDTWSEILDSMLAIWCPEFLSVNRVNIDQVGLGGGLLKKAFNHRLKGVPKLSPGLISTLKRQMKQRHRETRLTEFVPGLKPGKQLGKGMPREAKERAKQEISEQNARKMLPLPENPTRIQPSRRARELGAVPNPTSPGSSDDSSLSANLDVDGTVEGSDDGLQSAEKSEDGKAVPTDPEGGFEMSYAKYRSDQPLAEDELEQRHRYYPGLPDDAVLCLTCASSGHATADCPETTCGFCQQDHFSYRCPSRQRCEKCKQLGHPKSSCKEKLAVAAGEGFFECAFCQAQDHQEENCTEIWQTYRPQVGHTKKVNSMPIFCYCCGAEGHFGSDCGLANPRLPPSETWTLSTASLYLDPASSEEAVAYRAILPQVTATTLSAPVIPGRSIKPQSHIIFEDSGDEEADAQNFIRAPTAGPKRSGQILIKSNINFDALAGLSAPQGGAQESTDARQRRRQRQQQHNESQLSTLPPKPTFATQKGSQQRSGAPPPPPASNKGKKKGSRSGKNTQPPLPSGPPPGPPVQSNSGWRPQELMPQGRSRGGGRNRGRGGFSSLGRGGARGGRGGRRN